MATMVGDERIIGKGGAVWLWKNWRCFFFRGGGFIAGFRGREGCVGYVLYEICRKCKNYSLLVEEIKLMYMFLSFWKVKVIIEFKLLYILILDR